MKILGVLLMFVTLGVVARAQTQTPPAATVISDAKVTGGIAWSDNKGVKNSPFSAEAISESIQTLADGNRIVRTSTSKLYRSSDGRFRQEIVGGNGGAFGSFFTYGDGITIVNPGQGRFYIDSDAKTARAFQDFAVQAGSLAPLAANAAIRAVEAVKLTPEMRVDIERAKAELDQANARSYELKAAAEQLKATAEQMATTVVGAGVGNGVIRLSPSFPRGPKWETRTEDLGDQSYEGIAAHGTRTVTTIPAGAIGNERPIETTYEKWFSNELQMVVYSKQSDPRTGEHTYRLTNINRSEPDSSLFQVPSGFKVVSGNQDGNYTFNVRSARGVERAAAAKSSTAQGGTRTKNQN